MTTALHEPRAAGAPSTVRRILLTLIACAALIGGLPGVASAAPILTSTQLSASDPSTTARFGTSLSLSNNGSTLLVGNQQKSNPTRANSAYIFTKTGTTWTETAQLTGSDTTAGDGFGNVVALSGDGTLAAVSSKRTVGTVKPGSVYLFRLTGSTWNQVAVIDNPVATTSGGDFGTSLALSLDGSQLIAGASVNGSYYGSAFIFSISTSNAVTQTFSANGLSQYDNYGAKVAITDDGNYAAVGMPLYSSSGTYTPTVVTYKRTGTSWGLLKTIASPGSAGSLNDFGFGALGFSANGSQLLIGAASQSYQGRTAVLGTGYLYTWNSTSLSWGTPAVFTAPRTGNSSSLGASGSLSANGLTVLLGAPINTVSGGDGGGAAFVWTRASSTASWPAGQAYSASDLGTNDRFGDTASMSADGTQRVAGALRHTVGAVSEAGAVYTF